MPRIRFLPIYLTTILLRVLTLGLPPFTDEGSYASTSFLLFSQYTGHAVSDIGFLPSMGTLGLYPLMVSWIFALPGESLVLLRCVDALAVAIVPVLFAAFLKRHFSDSLTIYIASITFAVMFNHPDFVNAGFKNSIGIALSFLLLALITIDFADWTSGSVAGGLMAFAILLREPMFPFVFVLGVYVCYRGGLRSFFRYMLCFGLTVVVHISFISYLRGGLDGFLSLLQAYADYRGVQAKFSGLLVHNFLSSAFLTLRRSGFAIFPFLLGLVWPLTSKDRRSEKKRRGLYGLALGLLVAPVAEALVKFSFPYVFSQGLLGASLLIALGFETLHTRREILLGGVRKLHIFPEIPIVAVVTALLFVAGYGKSYVRYVEDSLYFADVMVLGHWDSPKVDESFYLLAARKVQEYSSPDQRVLVSGFLTGLYPLSHRLPPMGSIQDLTFFNLSKQKIGVGDVVAIFRNSKPDLFVFAHRGFSDETVTASAIDNFLLEYRPACTVPAGLRSYGTFSCTLYRR